MAVTDRHAWVVEPPDASARTLLQAAAAALGLAPRWLPVNTARLPRGVGRGHRRLAKALTATPDALVASWTAARHLEAATAPGDVVVMLDRDGLAGVFALEQVACDPAERRIVVVVAGGGVGIRTLEVAGTVEGLDGEEAAAVDWEVVAYRHADAVLVPSARAADAVRRLGGDPQVFVTADDGPGPALTRPPARVWAPEPFSRESQTAAICRAVAAVRERRDGVEVIVSTHDRPDRIWDGMAWDAARGVREVLGAALRRADDEPAAEVVVLGDPFAFPPAEAGSARLRGVPVVVAHGSAGAALWADAPTWGDADELAALLAEPATRSPRGEAEPSADSAATITVPVVAPPAEPARASRVSAAVPVFRDVRFLDAAVASLLDQTQPVHELLLLDDGSASPDVDAALGAWAERRGDVVRVLRQPNRGVCAARNLALEHMTGDAFVLLDQDDVLAPDFVASCAAVLRQRPEVWAVATWTEFFGAYEGVEAKPAFDARVGRRENPIVSTCALIDMKVRDLGLRFAEDLAWIYCEDWDLWAQIVAAGGAFGLVPRPLARHRVHPSSGGHRRTPLALALGRARATARLPPSLAPGPPALPGSDDPAAPAQDSRSTPG